VDPRPDRGPGNNVGDQVGNHAGVIPVQLGNYSGAHRAIETAPSGATSESQTHAVEELGVEGVK